MQEVNPSGLTTIALFADMPPEQLWVFAEWLPGMGHDSCSIHEPQASRFTVAAAFLDLVEFSPRPFGVGEIGDPTHEEQLALREHAIVWEVPSAL